MSKRGDLELLLDIQQAIRKISFYTRDLSLESFLKDNKTQEAVIYNFQIIGEAAKNLSSGAHKIDQAIEKQTKKGHEK